MRAPPPGLSQLATSFLACPRLGIPRAPLPRLASSFSSWPHLSSRLKRSNSTHPKPELSKNPSTLFASHSSQYPGPFFSSTPPSRPGRGPVSANGDRSRKSNGSDGATFELLSALALVAVCLLERSRKEVIQPQVPLRLPCYDFAPVTELAFGRSLPCGLGHGLRALPAPMA